MPTTRAEILAFARRHSLAVQATVSPARAVQAAVVGFIATDDFELFFDTVETTRKAVNLRQHASIAFVIGGMVEGDERTLQYEGVADEPQGPELEALKVRYYEVFPDGPSRLSWPGLIYVRVKPRWLRFSDFSANPPEIVEIDFP